MQRRRGKRREARVRGGRVTERQTQGGACAGRTGGTRPSPLGGKGGPYTRPARRAAISPPSSLSPFLSLPFNRSRDIPSPPPHPALPLPVSFVGTTGSLCVHVSDPLSKCSLTCIDTTTGAPSSAPDGSARPADVRKQAPSKDEASSRRRVPLSSARCCRHAGVRRSVLMSGRREAGLLLAEMMLGRVDESGYSGRSARHHMPVLL